MTVRLTERDIQILSKCAVARWLTTRQVRSYFFPAVTPRAAQKRLRKLTRSRYLRAWRTHPMAECIYTVGSRGKMALEARGKAVGTLERRPPAQVEHLVGINDIRTAVERGGLPVRYFYAAWELPQFAWTGPLIPDAVFCVDLGQRPTFMAEYDRATERWRSFSAKLRSYAEGWTQPFSAVLIITDTIERIQSLRRYPRKTPLPSRRFFAALLSELKQAGIAARLFTDIAEANPQTPKVSLRDFV